MFTKISLQLTALDLYEKSLYKTMKQIKVVTVNKANYIGGLKLNITNVDGKIIFLIKIANGKVTIKSFKSLTLALHKVNNKSRTEVN